ncbi:MerR family transcriptional regulator [Flavobacterium sp. LC2016-23]|uniref:MerR family transcriptional regulator n=1 Tax=Flavobacterium sp. LC2016-23 TaxID=2666330 RepID=UPI0012AEF0F1|nr:MerR family transcriptional regulator [Flavobacterium sp. LC2016-23]MRX38626.1 MerR family transcriptional regulator [Flavobacterium sp. LC2016-23]
MDNIKNTFTIKDLEHLTGIRAHTIRIWEKRYAILKPIRTSANFRLYDTASLQKILNICTLNSHGYKISHIAKMAEGRIPELVREILTDKTVNDHAISDFKIAMMNFDTRLFLATYNSLLNTKSFRDIFYDSFIPLLDEMGMLWQTHTITASHEHFISNLIKQKIILNIERQQIKENTIKDRTYVLYLPEGEIHEVGLMLINYELLYYGFHTVYLGESVPMEDIVNIGRIFGNVTFVTYLTIEQSPGDTSRYVGEMQEKVLKQENSQLIICGRCSSLVEKNHYSNLQTYRSVKEYTSTLDPNAVALGPAF